MKSKVITFLILILLFGCKKTKKKVVADEIQNPVNERIIYKFINNALAGNETYESCPNVLETKGFIYLNIDESELKFVQRTLKEKDSTFIKNQLVSREKFYWKENLLANKRIVKIDTTANTYQTHVKSWKKTISKYKCVLFVDQPLFNKELNLAIVKIQGADYRETILFQFFNGHWRKIKVLEIGIID